MARFYYVHDIFDTTSGGQIYQLGMTLENSKTNNIPPTKTYDHSFHKQRVILLFYPCTYLYLSGMSLFILAHIFYQVVVQHIPNCFIQQHAAYDHSFKTVLCYCISFFRFLLFLSTVLFSFALIALNG